MKKLWRVTAILLLFAMLIPLASCAATDDAKAEHDYDMNHIENALRRADPDGYDANNELNRMVEEGPAQGHWEMFEARTEFPSTNNARETYTLEQTKHTYVFDYKADPEVRDDEDFHAEFVATCTEPADVYYPGDVVSIHVKVEETNRVGSPTRICDFSCNAAVDDSRKVKDVPPLSFTRENGGDTTQMYTFSLSAGVGQYTGMQPVKSMEDTFSLTLPTTQKESQYRFYIYFHSQAGDSVWAYQWIGAADIG